MADRDLDALRAYRVQDAAPTPGLLERLEEDLLQSILDEEAAGSDARTAVPLRPQVRTGTPLTRWMTAPGGLARPAMAAAAAILLATGVAVLSDGGAGGSAGGTSGSANITQASANLFDATATALFGGTSSASAATGVATSPINTSSGSDEIVAVLAGGPGETTDEATSRAAQLPGDPEHLRTMLRQAAVGALTEATGNQVPDTGDRVAFYLGMRWVIDPDVPGQTRAAILRSLAGLDDIDRAVQGPDLLGRRGVVLSHYDESSGLREQYVLDPRGGELLERRTFTTAYVDPACPPGTYTDYALYVHGTAVAPAETPFLEWPATVASCDPSSIRLG